MLARCLWAQEAPCFWAREALRFWAQEALGDALLLALFAFSSLLASGAPVAAQEPCGSSEHPFVVASFDGDGWDPRLAAATYAEIRGELGGDGIGTCPHGPGDDDAIAIVALRVDLDAVLLEIRDAITGKRLNRRVPLDVPTDSRARTIALAVDELLRASWTELVITGHPPPARPPPIEVRNTVERSLPAPPRDNALGVRLEVAGYFGGQTHVGPDLFFRRRFGPRFGAELAFGFRGGSSSQAADGSVDSHAIGAQALLLFALFPRGGIVDFDFEAGIRVASVTFVGDSTSDAIGSEASNVVVYARGGATFALELLELLRLSATLGAGAPLRAFEATDEGSFVTGVSDLELYGSVAAGVGF